MKKQIAIFLSLISLASLSHAFNANAPGAYRLPYFDNNYNLTFVDNSTGPLTLTQLAAYLIGTSVNSATIIGITGSTITYSSATFTSANIGTITIGTGTVTSNMTVGAGNNGDQLIVKGGASGGSNVLMTVMPTGTAQNTGAKIFFAENVVTNQMAQIEVQDTGVNVMGTAMKFYTSTNSSALYSVPALTLSGTPGSNIATPLVGINTSAVPGAYLDVQSVNPSSARTTPVIRATLVTNNTGNLYEGLAIGGGTVFSVSNLGVLTSSSVVVQNELRLLSASVATIATLTPTAVGVEIYCNNCSALQTCVSSGTARGAWASPVAKTTACN